MATVRQFTDNISILNDKELRDYENALETLHNWELFEKEFGHGNSLALLRTIIREETTKRMIKKVV